MELMEIIENIESSIKVANAYKDENRHKDGLIALIGFNSVLLKIKRSH